MRALATTLLGMIALTGCASAPAAVPVVPQATLAAVVEAPAAAPAEEDPGPAPAPERLKHHVEITVDHLPSPKAFDQSATTYVFWVRANDDDAWANAAHLDATKEAREAKFEFADDTLFVRVTVEASPDARRPSDHVVLSTRVSANGACAHSVDEHDVTMKVRMCH